MAAAATPFTVTDAPASGGETSWSPDGRWIAYVDEQLHFRLSVVARDGSAWRAVAEPVLDAAQWSPDGRRLAWMSYQGIHVFDVGASTVREWPVSPPYYYWPGPWLRWSPDGERVVYEEGGHDFPEGRVIVSAWDGSARRDLGTAYYPEWAPDGQEIAFMTAYPDPFGLQAEWPDGTNRRVIMGTLSIAAPRWSRTADRIAYRDDYGVFVVSRDGTRMRSLETSGRRQLSWSPDGAWLAEGGNLIEVDGPGRVRLETDSWVTPRWSPSGGEVLYSRSGRIYVGSTIGSERLLAHGSGADWSPDGRQISFLRPPYDRPMGFEHCVDQVFVIDVDGTDERPVSMCRLLGSAGRDVIRGTGGPDEASALAGRDLVSGGVGADRISGGPGGDRLFGGPGEDVLIGGRGSDRLAAADAEADDVRCGPGHDVATVDAADIVRPDCEVVRRRAA